MNYQVVDYIVRPKNYSICKLDVNKYNIITPFNISNADFLQHKKNKNKKYNGEFHALPYLYSLTEYRRYLFFLFSKTFWSSFFCFTSFRF